MEKVVYMVKRYEYESVKITPKAKKLLSFMKEVLEPKLEKMGYKKTYSGLIEYFFDQMRDELERYVKELGVKMPEEIRLSELK